MLGKNTPGVLVYCPLSGRAHRPSWIALATAAAGAAMLALAPSSGAGRSPTLAQLRADDTALAAETRSAVLNLYSLDSQLDPARDRLGELDAEAQELRGERISLARQLRLAQLDSQLSQDRVALRLRYLYDYGAAASSLDVVLGSTSLDQVLSRLDDVNAVTEANQSVIVQLRSARSRLSALVRVLARRNRRLAQTTSAVAATVAALGQAQAQRASYISRLEGRRAYDAARISRLNAEALAAVERSQQLARERAAAAAAARQRLKLETPSPPGVVLAIPLAASHSLFTPAAATSTAGQATLPESAPRGTTITVVATGYDLEGRTSTGLPVGYGVAAVDPSVIPLGTRINVPGYGEAVAADTGGSIVGARIDLWFPTAAQANAWGRRTITVALGG